MKDAPSVKKSKKNDGRPHSGGRLFPFMAVLCAISCAVMVYALIATGNKPREFVPPPFEESAQMGTPEVPDGIGYGEVDAQAFKASLCGVFAPQDGKADVWLTNPKGSEVWLKLRVLDERGEILGETGLLRPGEYVQSVVLTSVPEIGETVQLKLMAYEPDTYHSAGAAGLQTTVTEKEGNEP